MTPQVVTLAFPPPPVEVAAFTVEFSFHAETWTAYSPTNATPTDFEDVTARIPIGDLDAENTLTIDGINGPTGNAAATTGVGNIYRCRWYAGGAYSNPGPVFRVL